MLITTKGCQGCTIARNSIKDAISQTKKSITFEERDTDEVKKKFLRTFGIADFPAILLFKDEEDYIQGSNLTVNYNYFNSRIQKEEISIDDKRIFPMPQ